MAVRTPHGIRPKERFKSCISRIRTAISSLPKPNIGTSAREPLPPDVKRSLIAMAALAVFACLFSFFMTRANSPDKAISTFLTSVSAQDISSFSSIVLSGREDLELTEESMTAFLALYHDQSAELEECRKTLNSDLTLLKQGDPSCGNGTVRLVELDRVLHKAYRVELSGADMFFSSNLDNTQVTVGGKSLLLEKAGTEYSLPLLPGQYDIYAVHTNETLGQSISSTVAGCELTQSNPSRHLELEYSAVILGDIGWDVASLTVNGTAFGPVTFDESGEFAIAPLPENADIAVTYNVNGVELCDRFTLLGGGSEYFYPSPTVTSETARDMLDRVGIVLQDLVTAYCREDPAALEAMSAYSKSSVLQNYHRELVSGLDPTSRVRYVYHYSLREITGDPAWVQDYSYDALAFTTTVFLGLDYTYERYDSGTLQTHLADGAPSVYKKDSMLSVCVQRVGNDWVVSDLEQIYFSDRSNILDPYPIFTA